MHSKVTTIPPFQPNESFCLQISNVCLLVCEEVCDQGNQFDDGKVIFAKMNLEEIKEYGKVSENVKQLEDRVKVWCKKLAEVLKESEQIRRESDSSGKLNCAQLQRKF